jgi:hypothetical protein
MKTKINKTKWMSTGYMKSAPSGGIDNEKGIIEGVSVCTVGEAKGHGVNLDREFVQRISELGSAKRAGLKARFGHPNMCSTALGTFIGRFKNFRQVEDQVKADLFLSNEAKSTPHGDLYSYVLGMATNEPDMFGISIVFTPGATYRRDLDTGEKVVMSEYETEPDRNLSEEIYVECAELHACDTVDDPAANEGLFSRFSQETIAGQITEFLDLNPQVWSAIETNPSIIDALARYGDKVDEFVNRYRDFRQHENGDGTMKKDKVNSDELEAVEEPQVEEQEIETPEAEQAEPVEEEVVEEAAPESEQQEEQEQESEAEVEAMSREQFVAVADMYGDDVAAQVMREGGSVADAADIAYRNAQKEIEQLKSEVAELREKKSGGVPASANEFTAKKSLFNTRK